MKKFLSLITVLALVAVTAVSASAAGINAEEKKVLDTIKAGVTVNGKTVNVPDNYLVQAENYLNTIDMTAEQANLSMAQKAADVVGLKITITGGSQIVITDSTGKTVATFDAAIKVTGGQADFTNAAVIAIAVLGVLGMAAFAARKYHLVKE